MKKRVVNAFVGAMITFLVLSGCGIQGEAALMDPGKTVSHKNVGSINKEESEIEQEIEDKYDSNCFIDGEKLTQAELNRFTSYFNKIENYGFLLTPYRNPDKINWNDVFLYGAGIGDSECSKEALSKFVNTQRDKHDNKELKAISGDDARSFVKEKTGITDFDVNLIRDYEYVESEDILLNYIKSFDDAESVICLKGVRNGDLIQVEVVFKNSSKYNRRITLVDTKHSVNRYRFYSNRQLWEPEVDKIIKAKVHGVNYYITCGIITDYGPWGPEIDIIQDNAVSSFIVMDPAIGDKKQCTEVKDIGFCDIDNDDDSDMIVILEYEDEVVPVICGGGVDEKGKYTLLEWKEGYSEWLKDNVKDLTAENVISYILKHPDEMDRI